MNETALRRLIEKAFSREELEGLCANVEQRLAAAGEDYPVDLDTVGGDTKPAQILNLVEYLKRRGHLGHLLAAVEEERPGLLATLPITAVDAPPDTPPATGRAVVEAAEAPDRPAPEAARVPDEAAPPQPMQGFVAAAGLTPGSTHVLVGCVLLEEPDRLRQLVSAAREDILHDPGLRDQPAVAALRKRSFDYASDDVEVRSRMLDLLAKVSFEAYVYFVSRTPGASEEKLFDRLAFRLLSDRLTSDRKRLFELWLDRRLASRLTQAVAVVDRAQSTANKEQRGVAGASLALAAPQEPAIAVAHYVCEIVHRKIEGPSELERRAFERLHPRKIRLIHELGTNRFFRGNRPMR